MAPHIARGESRRLSLDIIYNDEVVQSIVYVETTDFDLNVKDFEFELFRRNVQQ